MTFYLLFLLIAPCANVTLQVGVPFSDPLADGGTIQKANQTALANGTTLKSCIEQVAEARKAGLTVPVVFMGYFNPFKRYGEAKLVADCATAGVDGFIIVDLPCDDAADFVALCDSKGLGFIPLVAPTTLPERYPKIAAVARGFVYCVSVTGVTGARSELPADVADFLARVREGTGLPVALGFGISTAEQVESASKIADGVVMGSAIINRIAEEGVEGLSSFLRTVTAARAPRTPAS